MTWKILLMAMAVCGAAIGGARAQSVGAKKAYILVQSDVTNPDQYAGYAKLTPAIIEQYGGKFLTRGGRSATLEGRQAPARVVVLEFPNYDAAQAFYNGPEYTAARKVRAGAATMQIVVVEGL
jgi:uncharacterized protein (DUF1330 family)